MADELPKTGSWWATMPGILTATAAVITAATGLFAILAQNGVLGEGSKNLVSEKATAVRDAVTPTGPLSSADPAATAAKPVSLAATAPDATPGAAPASGPSSPRETAASGIVSAPLHAAPFKGAIVTLLDGSVVKLRDGVQEKYEGTVLKTTTGQAIEMQRMRRFDLSDWKNHSGKARITLNNGEVIDVRIDAYSMVGSNDLGDFSSDFAKIRSVEFVR